MDGSAEGWTHKFGETGRSKFVAELDEGLDLLFNDLCVVGFDGLGNFQDLRGGLHWWWGRGAGGGGCCCGGSIRYSSGGKSALGLDDIFDARCSGLEAEVDRVISG